MVPVGGMGLWEWHGKTHTLHSLHKQLCCWLIQNKGDYVVTHYIPKTPQGHGYCKLAKKRYDTPFGRVETCKTKYSNNESALIYGSRVRLHCTCEVWHHFLVADYFTCSKARGQSRRLNEHHRELKVDEWRAGGGNMHCKILTSRGHLWHNVRSAVSAVFNISDFQPVITKVAFVCGFLWRIKIWDTDNFRRKCLPVLLIQKQFGAFLCKFACSPCACVGSLQALPFLPTVQRHACLHNWWYLNWPQVP